MLLNTRNKTCSKCGKTKSEDEFGKDKSRSDGKYIHCKECVKIYNVEIRKKHNDKRTAYNKKYREENREKYNEWERNYYKNNSERLGNNAKRWRESRNGFFRMLHIMTKARAKKKNLPYEIDDKMIALFSELNGDKCKLTGIEFDLVSDGKHIYRPFAPSVDRIDNSIGYTLNNIQLVCVMVNKAKNEYTQEMFDEMCRARVRMLNGP